MHSSKKTWFVFTDACYEPTSLDWKCGHGGIIYSPCGSIFQSSNLFGGCPTVFYVDNNSARDVAISGCGRSAVANSLLDILLEAEMVFLHGTVESLHCPTQPTIRQGVRVLG